MSSTQSQIQHGSHRRSSVAKAGEHKKLGRLRSLGLSELWQVGLLLPQHWEDFTHPIDDFAYPFLDGISYALVGQVVSFEARFSGTPRLTGYLRDANAIRIGFTIFGDTREIEQTLRKVGNSVALFYGKISLFNNRPWMKSLEVVNPKWAGRLRPVYPAKSRTIGADLVRSRVLANLKESVPVCAKWIERELAGFGSSNSLAEMAGFSGETVEQILWKAHIPHSIEEGTRAQSGLELLAGLGIIKGAKGAPGTKNVARAFVPGDWRRRAANLPYALTDEQSQAIIEICNDLQKHTQMRRILSGDVGTGKTCVFGVVCAAVADGNGKSIVLLPNIGLADQVSDELRGYFPDVEIETVTAETHQINPASSVLVGTTALLHRSIPWQPDLLVVDEQQKFSREQREQLMGENTNLLESTATCIPRTMALARYGVIHVSKLTRCHCKKTIYTKIWHKPEWKQLYEQAMRTLSHGDQIMLVYPLREKAEVQDKEGNSKTASLSHLRSASEIYEIWNARFPGQVRLLHGQMENELKREVLDDLRSSKASIAICTSISEIGLTIPNLRRVIVVHPERHGLITLHQIRGRLARHGGEGYFDLFLPYPLKAEAFERLRVLEMTCNGFEVSELDMRLRGVGDLSHASDKQSGSDETFLFGRSVRLSLLDEAMRIAESAFAG